MEENKFENLQGGLLDSIDDLLGSNAPIRSEDKPAKSQDKRGRTRR